MTPSYEILLKNKNLNLTAVRINVLSALYEHPHSDAQKIFETVQAKIASATIQAIYNNLKVLTCAGIIQEIKPKGHASLYEIKTDDHHHIVCQDCGQIEDTVCTNHEPCVSPVNHHQFILNEAEIIFWGLCPSCQKTSKKPSKRSKYYV